MTRLLRHRSCQVASRAIAADREWAGLVGDDPVECGYAVVDGGRELVLRGQPVVDRHDRAPGAVGEDPTVGVVGVEIAEHPAATVEVYERADGIGRAEGADGHPVRHAVCDVSHVLWRTAKAERGHRRERGSGVGWGLLVGRGPTRLGELIEQCGDGRIQRHTPKLQFRIYIDGHEIEISHPDRIVFPDAGITKLQVAEYYAAMGQTMLPHVRDRAMTLTRYPEGISGEGFFQKATPSYFPEWIPRCELPKKGGVVHYPVVTTTAALVYFAQQNVITPHVPLNRIDDLPHPDRFVVDLDPSTDDFDQVRRFARLIGALLEQAGLVPFVQTTGSKGLHVVAPLDRSADWSGVQRFASAIAGHLLDEHPEELTQEFSKSNRGDRIYLDLGRNTPMATMVAPYGVRAIEGAPVATPIEWDEVDDPELTPRRYTIGDVVGRLDPWAHIDEHVRALRS